MSDNIDENDPHSKRETKSSFKCSQAVDVISIISVEVHLVDEEEKGIILNDTVKSMNGHLRHLNRLKV